MLTEAFDKMAEDIGQDKVPFSALWELVPRLPKPATVGGIGLDATAQRTEIDASFAKLWTVWGTFPERIRQKLIRDHTDRLTKQGMTPDAARAEAEKRNQPIPPLKVTAPNPDFRSGFLVFTSSIEADVSNGVKDEWSTNSFLRVNGSVQYSESLRLHCNGILTSRLRGQVGMLELHANGDVIADLVELNAPVIKVQANGNLLLRVGPGTNTVQVENVSLSSTILTRGNSGLKVEGAQEHPSWHGGVAVVVY